jgi:hypothetical protein
MTTSAARFPLSDVPLDTLVAPVAPEPAGVVIVGEPDTLVVPVTPEPAGIVIVGEPVHSLA